MNLGRTLGLDVGEKRIGISVSTMIGGMAQPVETLERKKLEYDIEKIIEHIENYSVSKIVIGLPKNMDGSIGGQGVYTQEFGDILSKYLPAGVEISYWDERLSSRSATRVLIEGNVSRKKRKGVIDKIAAVIILQNYLDAERNSLY